MTAAVSDLFGHYHRLIRDLASRCAPGDAGRSDLEQILQSFDEDCRKLAHSGSYVLRCDPSAQLKHEAFGFSHPDKSAVLMVAVKHLESAC